LPGERRRASATSPPGAGRRSLLYVVPTTRLLVSHRREDGTAGLGVRGSPDGLFEPRRSTPTRDLTSSRRWEAPR
jgi:hypothetical protein